MLSPPMRSSRRVGMFPLRAARLLSWACCLALCVLSGCAAPTGTVSGKVTYNGQRVGGAEIRFAHADKPDDYFSGGSGLDGTYQVSYRSLKGLPVGRYRVTVKVISLPAGVPFPPGEMRDSLFAEGKLIEASYVFERDIAAGENLIDFELTQGQKQEAPAES